MGADLRARNEGRCQRLLARSELLDTRGIAWDEIGATSVDPRVLDCLVYMRDVEGFTNRDLVGLVAHPTTLRDPVVSRFLGIWRQEEAAHARALDRYLTTYADRRGCALPSLQLPPPAVVAPSERWLVRLSRPVGHVITAAHMVWGAANELLTMTGYRLLARRSNDPTLAELLTRIAAQESRHFSFYALQAEWRLDESRLARRVLPSMMRRAWTPVGIGEGYKAPEEFDRVIALLADDRHGARAVTVMDNTFSRLPGFEGLSIYRRAVEESRERLGQVA